MKKLLTLFLIIFVSLINSTASELVICFAEDGHVAIEHADHEHTCDDMDHENEVDHENHGCSDFSIISDIAASSIQKIVFAAFQVIGQEKFHFDRISFHLEHMKASASFSFGAPPDRALFLSHQKTVVIRS